MFQNSAEDGWEVGMQVWSRRWIRSPRFHVGYEDLGSDMGERRKKEQIWEKFRGRTDIVTN